MILRPNGKPVENAPADFNAKATERMRHQRQDHHDIRAGGVASSAYAAGWERIFGKRKERTNG